MLDQYHTTRNSISLMPESLIDQIKAGEVIERPANLLKELVENAIDAGATKIKITLINNGIDQLAVEDNGHGISYEELPLAFTRHATSKIRSFKDLLQLDSLGFRGEALASIASIAKVQCQTQTQADKSLYLVEGSEVILHEKKESGSKTTGTKFTVTDLFYNTPARLKFIQSPQKEKIQLQKTLNGILINNPHIEFQVVTGEKNPQFFSLAKNLDERLDQIIRGKQHWLTKSLEYQGIGAQLWVSQECSKSSAYKHQYILVNKRAVKEDKLHRVLLYGLEKIWGPRLFGHYILKLDIPTDHIDINVHPHKTQVKFLSPSKVFALVKSLVDEMIPKQVKPIESIDIQESSEALQESLGTITYRNPFDENYQYRSEYEHKNSDTVQIQKPTLDLISSRYLLINIKECYLLMDILLFPIELALKKESESIPTFVKQPIDSRVKNYLLFFQKIGIEITQTDKAQPDQQFCLASFCEALDWLYLDRWIATLCTFFQTHHITPNTSELASFSSFPFSMPTQSLIIDTLNLEQVLETTNLQEYQYLQELSDQSLSTLFQSMTKDPKSFKQ